jgi:processing peptidase subunit alpha
MAETALHPRTDDLDMSIAGNLVHLDVSNGNSSKAGGARVLEALHEVGFGGVGLGAPLISVRDHLSGEAVRKFLADNLAPSRIVVAAVGVEHARLVEMAEKAFGDIRGSGKEPAASKYVGGDYRIPASLERGEVHVALGFQGVAVSDKDLLATAALQSLLGGGDSFSAGGPGKGLTSRIFANVLSGEVFYRADLAVDRW